jgi:hypothetical protein
MHFPTPKMNALRALLRVGRNLALRDMWPVAEADPPRAASRHHEASTGSATLTGA